MAAVFLPAYINPTYAAQGSLILSLPTNSGGDDPQESAPFNPFLLIPLPSLALSLGTTVEGADARREVAAAGLSEVYTVSRESSSSPLILVRAEGSTPEMAAETAKFVSQLIQQKLREQQRAVGVDEDELIQVLDVIPVVDAGAQLQSQQRLRVVVLALGIIVAALSAAGVEGWARHRRRGWARHRRDPQISSTEESGEESARNRHRRARLQENQGTPGYATDPPPDIPEGGVQRQTTR